MKKLIIAAMAILSLTAAGFAHAASNSSMLKNFEMQQVKKPNAAQTTANKAEEKAQVKKSKPHNKRHKKHKKAHKSHKAVKSADMKKKEK